jgi:hypothetical protein
MLGSVMDDENSDNSSGDSDHSDEEAADKNKKDISPTKTPG